MTAHRFCPSCGFHLTAPTPKSVERAKRRTLPRFQALFEAAADQCNVTVDDVLGTSKDMSVARARHLIAYVLRRDFQLSFPEIGGLLARDHTTAMHAVRRVERTPELMRLVDLVRAVKESAA